MENAKLDNPEKKQEVELVKKGLFYYIFQLIALPFKIIIWVSKSIWKYVSTYLGWLREHFIHQAKKKNLNKVLSMNKLRDEIL